jgi:Z1 domain
VTTFDISRFQKKTEPTGQYERQLRRLTSQHKEVICIEKAVGGAFKNLREKDSRSFVIYGEPQSGKTEMMICLTSKLLDEGYLIVIHLLNDSVDLLDQNLGRFKSSGLAPAARNFSEVLDPAVKIKGQRLVIFCKKNGADLRKLLDKLDGLDGVVVIDDEADYASPNARVNTGGRTTINELITQLLGDNGIYIGVTATPARLDLNNTFDNDSTLWVDFPPHNKYTGQDVFFPLDSNVKYLRTFLPDAGSDPKYARQALFGFLVNVAYLNKYVNLSEEKNYSFLVHTSGKKADHKTDWKVINDALGTLIDRKGNDFEKYAKLIWDLSAERYADTDPNTITNYILDNISRSAIVILNSTRDWNNNSSAATDPKSLFTIIIGGNIVSRGVTLDNLLSMFFTRDVHKIQQDTYIQRARMFGSRGDYLRFFELTIPRALYLDWHRCFVFHRLALAAINDGLGSLVWLSDQRIVPVANSSIDQSTVDLNRGEMSFGLFDYNPNIAAICLGNASSVDKLDALATALGETAFPGYLRRYIQKTAVGGSASIFVHPPSDISGRADADTERISRVKGFYGKTQKDQAPASAVHRLMVLHNGDKKARLLYKFIGSIQFIKNTAHDR